MRLYWRLGVLGWQIAARLGLPIKIKINICHDKEANVYYAVSGAVGLAVEAETIDGVMLEINHALPTLLDAVHASAFKPKRDIRLNDNFVAA